MDCYITFLFFDINTDTNISEIGKKNSFPRNVEVIWQDKNHTEIQEKYINS
jgi:hypothetical protein